MTASQNSTLLSIPILIELENSTCGNCIPSQMCGMVYNSFMATSHLYEAFSDLACQRDDNVLRANSIVYMICPLMRQIMFSYVTGSTATLLSFARQHSCFGTMDTVVSNSKIIILTTEGLHSAKSGLNNSPCRTPAKTTTI